jgi:hypothetical protein
MDFINDRMKELHDDFKEKDIFEKLKQQTQISLELAIAHPKYVKLTTIYI